MESDAKKDSLMSGKMLKHRNGSKILIEMTCLHRFYMDALVPSHSLKYFR